MLYSISDFWSMVALYTTVYIYLQTFMVPGCFFLNLLIGAFLPFFPALLYITVITTLGCTFNYLLSQYVLAPIIRTRLAGRVVAFKTQIARHRGHLFYYLMLLRIIPAFPSWAINIACPIVNIPLSTFAMSTAIGFQPQVCLAVSPF